MPTIHLIGSIEVINGLPIIVRLMAYRKCCLKDTTTICLYEITGSSIEDAEAKLNEFIESPDLPWIKYLMKGRGVTSGTRRDIKELLDTLPMPYFNGPFANAYSMDLEIVKNPYSEGRMFFYLAHYLPRFMMAHLEVRKQSARFSVWYKGREKIADITFSGSTQNPQFHFLTSESTVWDQRQTYKREALIQYEKQVKKRNV
jgi:hypothetical protein